MRRILSFFPVLVMCICVYGCQEEPGPDQGRKVSYKDSAINLTILNDSAETKAGSPIQRVGEPIDLSEQTGISGFTIREEVTSLDAMYNLNQTKGTPVYTENLAELYSTISVAAYDSDGEEWAGEEEYEYDEGTGKWRFEYGTDFEWPSDETLRLFVKVPVESDEAGITGYDYNSDGSITFTYESPTGSDDSGNPADAVAQKDILFTSLDIEKATKDTKNNILLYHALTGVKFKLGSGSGKLTITSVDKVEFSGLMSTGECTITPKFQTDGSYSGGSNPKPGTTPKSAAVADWGNSQAEPATFTQTFYDDDQGVNLTAGEYTFPDSIKGANGTAASNNLNDALTAEKTFMFIPQELYGNGISLTIWYTYTDGTGEDAITAQGSVTIENFGEKMAGADATSYEWKAGELRTYSITVGDRVDVAIVDEVDQDTRAKSGLEITNTGTAIAYMRVIAYGNWVYSPTGPDDHTVVAITPCPQFDAVASAQYNSTDWIQQGDFFYYKYPVPGGQTIPEENTLFEELDLSDLYDSYLPYSGCHLQVDIAVQAVRASEVESAWGAISGLEK